MVEAPASFEPEGEIELGLFRTCTMDQETLEVRAIFQSMEGFRKMLHITVELQRLVK